VRFAADRGMNGHADRFWGLALAVHAAKRVAAPVGFQTVAMKTRGMRYAG
jgi:phage FluMu gp28-like protein